MAQNFRVGDDPMAPSTDASRVYHPVAQAPTHFPSDQVVQPSSTKVEAVNLSRTTVETKNASSTINGDASNANSEPDNKAAVDLDRSSTLNASNAISHIEKLPNELISHILSCLDIEKPSNSAFHDEPTFELTNSAIADLKSSSRTCRRWRTLAIPLLFKNARLSVSNPETEKLVLNQIITPFFDFVKLHSLRNVITSFILLVRDTKIVTETDDKDRLTNNYTSFWYNLLEKIDPIELLIVAHPSALGALTSCHVFLEDAWSFDCPCHYLRLQRSLEPAARSSIADHLSSNEHPADVQTRVIDEPVAENLPINNAQQYSTDSFGEVGVGPSDVQSTIPPSHEIHQTEAEPQPPTELEPWELPRAESSALFEIRPWTNLLLNEGSFIRAYATYEFWLRQAPSILSDLMGADEPHHKPFISPTIRDFSYIGVFPFERHFRALTENLPRLDRLYIQLIPRNDILDTPSKIVQVEAEDLWMERNSCYATLIREMFNTPPLGNYKHLKVFESGDAADQEAWFMAVEYVKRAGNEWKIAGDGVLVRDIEENLSSEAEDDANDDWNNSTFQGSLVRWAWNGIMKLPVSAVPMYMRPMGQMD